MPELSGRDRQEYQSCLDILDELRLKDEDRLGIRKNAGGTVSLKLGNGILTVTPPKGYIVMNDESGLFDSHINDSAAQLGHKELLTLGTPEDLELAKLGKPFLWDRHISVRQNIDKELPDPVTGPCISDFKRDLEQYVKAGNLQEMRRYVNDVVSRSAPSDSNDAVSNGKLDEMTNFGVFDRNEHSLCHTHAAKVTFQVNGKPVTNVQVGSQDIIHALDKVILVIAVACYESPENLKWTQESVRKMRDEILQSQNENGWKTAR